MTIKLSCSCSHMTLIIWKRRNKPGKVQKHQCRQKYRCCPVKQTQDTEVLNLFSFFFCLLSFLSNSYDLKIISGQLNIKFNCCKFYYHIIMLSYLWNIDHLKILFLLWKRTGFPKTKIRMFSCDINSRHNNTPSFYICSLILILVEHMTFKKTYIHHPLY